MKKILFSWLVLAGCLFAQSVDFYKKDAAYYRSFIDTDRSVYRGTPELVIFNGNAVHDMNSSKVVVSSLGSANQTEDAWHYVKFFLPEGVKKVKLTIALNPVSSAVIDMIFVPNGSSDPARFDHTGFHSPVLEPGVEDEAGFYNIGGTGTWDTQGTMRFSFHSAAGVFISVQPNQSGWFYFAIAEELLDPNKDINDRVLMKMSVNYYVKDLEHLKAYMENPEIYGRSGIPKEPITHLQTVNWEKDGSGHVRKVTRLIATGGSGGIYAPPPSSETNDEETFSSNSSSSIPQGSVVKSDGCPEGTTSEISENNGRITCRENPLMRTFSSTSSVSGASSSIVLAGCPSDFTQQECEYCLNNELSFTICKEQLGFGTAGH